MLGQKYASFDILDARVAKPGQGLVKDAHRHSFDYEPRTGYLYVRSRAISSRMNDNFDQFPAEEIKKAYKTFIGKPVFVNHNNDNHRRARGVIKDAVLHEDFNSDGSPDTWVEVLMEVDAVRFPMLAMAIVKREIERTSMGTDVAYSVCSYCGNKASTPLEYCKHIPKMKGMKVRRVTASGAVENHTIGEICYGLGFFENSLLVEDPADPTAFFLGDVDTRGMPDLAMAASKTASKTAAAPPPRVAEIMAEMDVLGRKGDKANPFDLDPATGVAYFDSYHILAKELQALYPLDLDPRESILEQYKDHFQATAKVAAKVQVVTMTMRYGSSTYASREQVQAVIDTFGADNTLAVEWTDTDCHVHVALQRGDTGAYRLHALASHAGIPVVVGSQASLEGVQSHHGHQGLQHRAVGQPGAGWRAGVQDRAGDVGHGWQRGLDGVGRLPDLHRRGSRQRVAAGGRGVGVDPRARAQYVNLPTGVKGHIKRAVRQMKAGELSLKKMQGVKAFYRAHVNYQGTSYVIVFQELGGKDEVVWVGTHEEANKTVYKNPRTFEVAARRDEIMSNTGRRVTASRVTEIGGARRRVHAHDDDFGGHTAEVGPDGKEYCAYIDCPGLAPGSNVAPDDYDDEYHDACWKSYLGDGGFTARKVGYGEQKAPAQVDTLGSADCPVCGEDAAYNGADCQVCGFVKPPDMFGDPDLDKAREMDLRQDQQDIADEGAPDLTCDHCGETFKTADAEVAHEDKPEVAIDDDGETVDVSVEKPDAAKEPEDDEELDENGKPKKKKAPPWVKGAGVTAAFPPAKDEDKDQGEKPSVADEGGDEPADTDTAAKAGDTCPECGQGTLRAIKDSAVPKDDAADQDQTPTDSKNGKPEFLKGNTKDARTRRVPTHEGAEVMRPALEALAAQEKVIEGLVNERTALKAQVVAAHDKADRVRDAVVAIATAAGISGNPRVASLLGITAADENPANTGWAVDSQPAAEAPAESTQEALTPDAKDDVMDPGSTPATDVSADATTSLDSTETVLDVPLNLNEQNVEAPVAGTDTLGEGERGQANTNRTETEVRTGTPADNSAAFRDGGFLGSKEEREQARTFASLRLARLRTTAGIAEGDDLTLGASIASSPMTDLEIQTEIDTLAKVVTAKAAQPAPQHLVPTTASAGGPAPRLTPSLASSEGSYVPEPQIGAAVESDEVAFE